MADLPDFLSDLNFITFIPDDKESVMEAAKKHGHILDSVSDRLKDDREVVLTAVQEEGSAIQYASKRLRNDREIALVAIQRNPFALEFLSSSLKDDEEIVMMAVKRGGTALYYASKRLRDNREIALTAAVCNPMGFCAASKRLKADETFVTEVINKIMNKVRSLVIEDTKAVTADNPLSRYRYYLPYFRAFQFEGVPIANTVFSDNTVFQRLLLEDVIDSLKNDKKSVYEGDIADLPDFIRDNITVIVLRAAKDPSAIKNLDDKTFMEPLSSELAGLLTEKETVLKLVEANPMCVHWLDKEILKDEDVKFAVMEALYDQEARIVDSVSDLYDKIDSEN